MSERLTGFEEKTLLSEKPAEIRAGLNIHEPARMPTGSYPGCCRVFTGVSSGGTCSRLSGSARLGIDDGWNIRCAFHVGATSSLVDGTPCAFTGDTRPSTIAAAGAGAILRPHRRSEVVERDFPPRCSLASNHENANARFITCPLGSDRCRCVSMIDHCPKKHREPLTEAPASLWST